MKNPRPTVLAIYCPVWHRYDHMDSWKGPGWNEWELLRTAPPRFPGHYQPLKPTWGCFDESDPKWAAREIDLAADHGIDVFLFDWYWYNGVKLMEEALENGFLRAPNRRRLKFALMWANHTWADYFPAPRQGPWNIWLPLRHSVADLNRVVDYCTRNYFNQPNYWRLDDELFFSIFDARTFVDQLGGAEKTRRAFTQINRALHARGLPSIHWNAMTNVAKPVPTFKAAGFSSTTSYNVVASGKVKPTDEPIDQYEDLIEAHRHHWRAMDKTGLPHMPVVTMGWDVTPRCEHDAPWPFGPVKTAPKPDRRSKVTFPPPLVEGERRYPYIHVVVGNTPKRFEQLCRHAQDHLQNNGRAQQVVMVNAWNEWTEGCYLLPEARYGNQYLDAMRTVFGSARRRAKI